ncbi:hypothetical protein BKI52_42195 [marine bacterium AO1-C]|nr:hypothetical protein BKI52_42195 [marine bacterium AO1-C]
MSPKYTKICLLILALMWAVPHTYAQTENSDNSKDDKKPLLLDMQTQIDIAHAINAMYNFKFELAENSFEFFREKHPNHPMPYFLFGLSNYWKIMPNQEIKTHDEKFLYYMDKVTTLAKGMYRKNKKDIEASFFLSAGYGLKATFYAYRKKWRKSLVDAKAALKYLRRGKKIQQMSPELLFGDAMYNYYTAQLRKEKPLLRPLLALFPKGNKQKGLEQLTKVAYNAFYTRTEAQYHLMEIYRYYEKNRAKALQFSQYLYKTFPDNPYFERSYASIAFTAGWYSELIQVSNSIMNKINAGKTGYEAISGRYASYFLGYTYRYRYPDKERAKDYFQLTVKYAEQSKSYESGYYQSALKELARMARDEKKFRLAKRYYRKVKKYAKRRSKRYKEAKAFLRKYRRLR